MSNTSLSLIESNTSLSQQTPSNDTESATFHHQPPPTPLPQRQQTSLQCKEVSEENVQDGIPLTAAGLTRALETNQGQSLTEIINICTANPSHLFWVPASQHLELEKYVVALRANAKDKGKVKRRRSVLSQSFTAADNELRNEWEEQQKENEYSDHKNDDDEDDDEFRNTDNNKEGERQFALGALENKHHQHVISLGRSNSLQAMGDKDGNNHHLLSEPGINQQHAGRKDHGQPQTNKHTTKARKERLRRSMSLHLPGNTDTGGIPDFLVFDRNSTALDQSPVLVPKTDRPLSRRGARTRFQRTSSIAPSTTKSTHSPHESQWPTYRHSDSIYTPSSSSPSPPTITTSSNSNGNNNNDDNGKGTGKYNNYSGDLEMATQTKDEQPVQPLHLTDSPIVFEEPQTSLDLITPLANAATQQQPATNAQQHDTDIASRIESVNMNHSLPATPRQSMSAISSSSNIAPPNTIDPFNTQEQPAAKVSPRERKSSWSWSFWSDEKKSKLEQPSSSSVSALSTKTNRDHQRQLKPNDGYTKTDNNSPSPSPPPPMVTSTSTPTNKQRFGFSSLFSRKNSSSSNGSGTHGGKPTNEDHSTNSAMLIVPPKDFQLNKVSHQHRLPIHVERAVYRLSHTKLANPRRPLRDQVIISNFMFWYLTIISEQQQNQSQNQSIPSVQQQHNSTNGHTSRHNPPRTPQQIVSASKSKKKRLTKKSNHQIPVTPVPTLSSSASSSSSSSVSSHQSKHSSSISQKTSSNNPYQQHHSLSSLPSPQQQLQQHHTQDKSWQHYIDGSSKQASTGFVIPENYLRPTSESNINDTGNSSINGRTDMDKQRQQSQRQYRQYVRRNSSSSEDDDDDDDEDDEEDDDGDYDTHYKDKNSKPSKSFYPGSKSKHPQKEKTAKQMSKHMQKQRYPTGHLHQQHRMASPATQSTPSSS